MMASLGASRIPLPVRSTARKPRICPHVLESARANLATAEAPYPKKTKFFLLPVRSDQYPENTFSMLEMLSPRPPVRPTMKAVPPSDVMYMGRMETIISLLRSVSRLTIPSRRMLAPMPAKSRFLMVLCRSIDCRIEGCLTDGFARMVQGTTAGV